MSSPLKAEVVNAFIDPVVEVIKACVGFEARLGRLNLTSTVDPPPSLSCTIEVRGPIAGPVTWVFTEDLARAFASRILAIDSVDDLDLATCNDAVAELANIVSGNATGRLQSAGYHVELLPPRVLGPDAEERQLTERTLVVTFDTEVGDIKMLIGVRQADILPTEP